jgi:hypothetical protein
MRALSPAHRSSYPGYVRVHTDRSEAGKASVVRTGSVVKIPILFLLRVRAIIMQTMQFEDAESVG